MRGATGGIVNRLGRLSVWCWYKTSCTLNAVGVPPSLGACPSTVLDGQPYAARKFILKYQDRVLFGSDGGPSRKADEFWRPHWRFLETDDEYFDHPAQMLSPLGAPLQGRWKIYGIFLPEDVLRKVYYENALRFLPAARDAMKRHLSAAGG